MRINLFELYTLQDALFELSSRFCREIPSFVWILSRLKSCGRIKMPLGDLLKEALVDPRYRQRFIEGLARSAEHGNMLFAVKPFDVDAARGEKWRDVEIEIYSDLALETHKKSIKEAAQ